jgi:hypothetical protein
VETHPGLFALTLAYGAMWLGSLFLTIFLVREPRRSVGNSENSSPTFADGG